MSCQNSPPVSRDELLALPILDESRKISEFCSVHDGMVVAVAVKTEETMWYAWSYADGEWFRTTRDFWPQARNITSA